MRDGEYVAIGRSLLQKRGGFLSNKSRDREIAPTVGWGGEGRD